MEIFERMVSSTTTTGPLQHYWETRVRFGDVDDLLDSLHGTGLETNVLDAKSLNVFVGDLN